MKSKKQKFNKKAYNKYWDNQTEESIKNARNVLRWLRSFDNPAPAVETAITALYHLVVDTERVYAESKELRK